MRVIGNSERMTDLPVCIGDQYGPAHLGKGLGIGECGEFFFVLVKQANFRSIEGPFDGMLGITPVNRALMLGGTIINGLVEKLGVIL